MPMVVDGEEFLNTKEAIAEFGVSKQSFYSNAKRYLKVYRFGAKRTPWYNKNEVLALARGKPIRHASIAITGMFSDWTEHARSLGYRVQTTNRGVTVGTLPQDLAEEFHIPPDQTFVKRSRMSWVDGKPICAWDSYYPVDLVSDILPQMQDGTAHDILEHIREKHGVSIGEADDLYTTRVTTFDEQNLFQLLNDEPLLILQRVARTEDQKVIVLFSDMQLLGSWFVIKRTEKVHHWDR